VIRRTRRGVLKTFNSQAIFSMKDVTANPSSVSVKTDRGRRIAVIGSGISGLGAAWLLSRSSGVTLFEENDYYGGHSNTVFADTPRGRVPVDTGFIVYNAPNYPNLTALFDHLGVETRETTMSFSASLNGGRFEYSGSGLAGLLAQPANAAKPRFWTMVRDILRFYEEAPKVLSDDVAGQESLGDYLKRNGYGERFIQDHLLPMAAAIWSAPTDQMMAFPMTGFVRFFVNHGLLQVKGRPLWRTVTGGSREYVKRLLADADIDVRKNTGIVRVRRLNDGVELTDRHGVTHLFDHVVMASHADQSLAMIKDATDEERAILGAFAYQKNRAILHSDPSLMPRRKRAWAAWNYCRNGDQPSDPVSVTYWMNVLQHLDKDTPLFVSLNPDRKPAPDLVHYETEYDHPLFDSAAIRAQRDLWRIQGAHRTWFCGAYCGYGFHEDGLQSGLAVAEALSGVRRPWTVANESGRIHLGPSGRMVHNERPFMEAAQ